MALRTAALTRDIDMFSRCRTKQNTNATEVGGRVLYVGL